MMKFYQNALSESAKMLINSEAQIKSHVNQLGKLRAESLGKQIIGKEFPVDALLESCKDCQGEYEKVGYKAVHVDADFNSWNLLDSIRNNSSILTISVVFVRDPDVILKSNIKLTDLEKKLLRKLRRYYAVSPGRNSRWFTCLDVANPGDQLPDLRNSIHAVIRLYWKCSLEQLLSEDFLTRGIKAEKSLTL